MHYTERAWNTALRAYFYNPVLSQRPAYLCIDDQVLDHIARANQMDTPSGAAQALIDTVRQNVRSRRPTSYWHEQAVAWKMRGYIGDPPFLTVLAISVLSVTRNDPTTGTRSYYKTLRNLLGLPEMPPGCPEDFDSDTQSMWIMLNYWLGQELHGSYGLPTASNDHGYSNIAWPTSQAIMQSSDRARLPQFFTELGFEYGETLPAEFPIVDRLRSWVRSGHSVSKRLKHVLSTKGLTRQLDGTLRMELLRWDGAERDECGVKTLPLLLTWDEYSRCFGSAVKAAPDVEHGVLSVLGDVIKLEEAGSFSALPIHVQDFFAACGHQASVTLENNETIDVVLRRTCRDCVVLSFNDDLGQFCEVQHAELDSENLVIAHPDCSAKVEAAMGRLGTFELKDRLSRGKPWKLYKYTPTRSALLDTGLTQLVPGGGQLATVEGGLLIDRRRRIYLVDGPPDVHAETGQSTAALAIDGQRWNTAPRNSRYRLAEAQFQVGAHEINVDGRPMSITLVDHVQTGSNLQPGLGHPLRPTLRPTIFELVERGAQVLESDRGAPTITGAVVQGLPTAPTKSLSSSIATSAQGRHFLVGDPGEAAEIFPESPAWLGSLNLNVASSAADVAPCLGQVPFTSKWYVHRGPSGAAAIPSTAFDTSEGVAPKRLPRVGPDVWKEVAEMVDVVEVAAADYATWSRWRDTATAEPPGRQPE
ncbi:hypothetical protein ACFWMR_02640 [Amycolatopsis thailandensis]|uniref:hypothetical protein n=1 Tax=Amycolatopsis thailandensis TaxID=589330 RepID=UPI003658E200